MTTPRHANLDITGIQDRLGPAWLSELIADDTVRFNGPDRTIVVSFDPDSEPDVGWIHASISYHAEYRIPSYSDLKQLHAAVFPDGHAYQCFVPPSEHISIRTNVLHLWGRLDGAPALPNFGRMGTI